MTSPTVTPTLQKLSVPGKTFLLGEHVATDGGPSILLSTNPRFELQTHRDGARGVDGDVTGTPLSSTSRPLPFHLDSPAGKFFSKHASDFEGQSFEFFDQHAGKGGLGASSAQFLLMMAQWRLNTAGSIELGGPSYPWSEVLREYRACAWNGEGTPPSGADIVSQSNGGVTYFDGRIQKSESLEWKFDSIGFTLIRTGHKLATHEHLRAGGAAPHDSLRKTVVEGYKAFHSGDEMRLIEAVQAAAHVLRESGLTTERTKGLLDQMRMESRLFFAVKGCGAMGADVILAIHERTKESEVAAWAAAIGLETCGAFSDLADGLVSTKGT